MVDFGVAADPAGRAIDRLEVVAPETADRARRALSVLLVGVRSSCWPDVAWRFSRLTASGCPVELSFSSADPALRYTVEVAGPEVESSTRLSLAEHLIRELDLDGSGLPDDLRRRLAGAQSMGELRWGAWVGARHDFNGSRYKLYAEVPNTAAVDGHRLTDRYLAGPKLLEHREPRLHGIGYEPKSGQVELYFRVGGLEAWETGVLLLRAGLGARQADLLELMERVYRRPVPGDFPRHQFGFSYKVDGLGRPAAFTLFSYAADVYGTDAYARRALLEIGPELGWELDSYYHVSEPLADVETQPTHHTVLAFTVAGEQAATLTVGLVPL